MQRDQRHLSRCASCGHIGRPRRVCLDDLSPREDVTGEFLAAARAGDFDALVATLDPDVVLRADGGAALAVAGGSPAVRTGL